MKTVLQGEESELTSPFAVATRLHGHSDKAMEMLGQLDGSASKELNVTLHDIRTVALLGKYYALKIEGATNLALYRQSDDEKYQDEAVEQLTDALEVWKQYTGAAIEQNINPFWTNRVGYVDWSSITGWVEDDIKIALK